jgi:hypothetical protein
VRAGIRYRPARADVSTIFVVSPDTDKPLGGIKQLYRHVDILNDNGLPASILHETEGFRCTWFENRTPVSCHRDVLAWRWRPGDFVVVPEIYGPGTADIIRGVRKVIFNQNCYYTFRNYPLDVQSRQTPYMDDEVVAALVVSEDSAAYLRYVFPHLNVARIRCGIDPALFHDSPVKKKQIALMTNKNLADLEQVLNILKFRDVAPGYEFVVISGRKESEVAAILRQSAIFLSFGNREGFSPTGRGHGLRLCRRRLSRRRRTRVFQTGILLPGARWRRDRICRDRE